MEKLQINYGNHTVPLELNEELGKGAFGTVYLATDEKGTRFAVKRSRCVNNATYRSATQEIEILMNLEHENIAKMYAFDFINNETIITMEFCDGGNLNQRLEYENPDELKLDWIYQLLNAMSYLHSKKIVHRDLKPENVLLSNDFIKLTDFGISRFYYSKVGEYSENSNLSEYMGSFVGTPYWIAPEVFEQKYDEKADLFSLGVLFYAILHKDYMMYNGVKYFGCFQQYQGQKIGIGVKMANLGVELQPEKRYTANENVDYVVFNFLRKDPTLRMSLQDAMINVKTQSSGESVMEFEKNDEEEEEVKKNDGSWFSWFSWFWFRLQTWLRSWFQ